MASVSDLFDLLGERGIADEFCAQGLEKIVAHFPFVYLENGHVALVAREDLDAARKHKWWHHREKWRSAARGRLDPNDKSTETYLHRWIAERHHGAAPPHHVCLARNGNYLDCRPGNLYWCHKFKTPHKLAKQN